MLLPLVGGERVGGLVPAAAVLARIRGVVVAGLLSEGTGIADHWEEFILLPLVRGELVRGFERAVVGVVVAGFFVAWCGMHGFWGRSWIW